MLSKKAYHDESQRLSVSNEPAGNKQANGQQDSDNGKPVLSGPPKSEQEADAKDQAGDFAGDDVETAKDEQSSDQR
jgi:hypothetical protein